MNDIVVIGNLFRFNWHDTSKSNQNGNIIWVYNLLKPIIFSVFKKDIKCILFKPGSAIDIHKIYEFQGLDINAKGFASIINSTPSSKTLDYIKYHLFGCFIIGYELPEIMIKSFNILGIKYIDIILSPIRFMPDLEVGMRTNDEYISNVLLKNKTPEELKYGYSGLRKATLSRLPVIDIKYNSCVFAGQVSGDVSLIHEGKYIEFNDYIETINDDFKKYNQIYFKPHPYQSIRTTWEQFNILNKINKTYITSHNIYRLMGSENILCIGALTSSVVHESRYFGVKSIMFSKYPFIFYSGSGEVLNKFIPIYNKLLDYSFWGDILNTPHTTVKFSYPNGALKNSLGLNWGADIFEQSHSEYDYKKIIRNLKVSGFYYIANYLNNKLYG